MNHLYEIKLVHRVHDWDATLRFMAPDSRKARAWALNKMARPDWLAVSAKRVK